MWAVIRPPKVGKTFGHEKTFCKHSNTDEIICTHCQLTASRIDYVLNGVKYVERV